MLSTQQLVIDQVRTVFRDDFDVRSADGTIVGHIHTQGGLGSRMFLGNRDFTVTDATGEPVLRLVDEPNFGRDRFTISGPRGEVIGEVVKEISFFRTRLSIELADGRAVSVTGDFFGFDYEISGPNGPVARIARHWPGLASSLLGRDRYVLAFSDDLSDDDRRAALGATIAIDLIRAKADRSRSS